MSNLKYAKSPYLLNDEELSKKPMSDVSELVKYIEEATKEIVDELAIHADNLKLIRKLLSNQQKIAN